jgi:hypothetical protein
MEKRRSNEPVTDQDEIAQAVLKWNQEGVDAIREADANDPDSLINLATPYPPPLLPGVSAYRDPAAWKADWREGLPKSHPHYVPDAELITFESDEYWEGLEAAVKLGIAKHSGIS